jgi:hypothetical protein
VVVFDGAETLFVLRRVDGDDCVGAWKLIGDCYVDGWMDGGYNGNGVVGEVSVFGKGDRLWERRSSLGFEEFVC